MILEVILRRPYFRQRRKAEKTDRQVDLSEQIVLAALFVGTLLLPLVYSLAPWLDFADYGVSASAGVVVGILGLPIMAAAIWVFWRAHRDLGADWPPLLEIQADHRLVTSGIHGSIRHPMYASFR